METGSPHVYIIAGPNGTGKTTFATRYLPHVARVEHFVNADLIAKGLSPFNPALVAMRAGRIVLEEIQRYTQRVESFGFETTLAGMTYVTLLKELKTRGFRIQLFYLWPGSVEVSLGRIRVRVQAGGHDVPEVDVRRRFRRSLHNFFHVYRPLVDSWVLYNNAESIPVRIAYEEAGKTEIFFPKEYAELLEMSVSHE